MNTSGMVSSLLLMLQVITRGFATGQTLQLAPFDISQPITHKYEWPQGVDTQPLVFSNLTAHLNNFTTVTVAVNAPTGYAWHVASRPQPGTPLEGLPKLGFIISFGQTLGGGPYAYAAINSNSIAFDFVEGGAEFLSSAYLLSQVLTNGTSFSIGGHVAVTGNVSFTSFTMTATFDNSMVAVAPLDSFLDSSLNFGYLSPSADPGPQLALIPIPQPIGLLWQTVRFPGVGDVLVLTWTNSLYSLQSAPAATGVYTNIPDATSPFAVSTSGLPRFFQLKWTQ